MIVEISSTDIRGLPYEVARALSRKLGLPYQRESWIAPCNRFLRIWFYLVRSLSFIFPGLRRWTRTWKCSWRVRSRNGSLTMNLQSYQVAVLLETLENQNAETQTA